MEENNVIQIMEIERQVQNFNKAGMHKEKIKYCQKGLEIDPNNKYLLSNMGIYYYMDMADYERAYLYFRKGLELGDTLPILEKNYWHCVLALNLVPDVFDVKLLKKYYDNIDNLYDYHAVVIERIIRNNENIDPQLLMILLLYKMKKREYEEVQYLCDAFIDKLPDNSMGLKAIENMIICMRRLKNLTKYNQYLDKYKQIVYLHPERSTGKRLSKIRAFGLWLENHKEKL